MAVFGKDKPDPYQDECEKCLFFFDEDSANASQGACRRFPKHEIVSKRHWCGEYQDDPGPPKAAKK